MKVKTNKTSNFRDLSLGKKIKMLRIERKITQQELVGDFITRNMLSQIENDVASPSMKTLRFLAEKLGVPLSYLMRTENDGNYGAEYGTVEDIDARAKKLFFSGNCADFIETAEKNPEILEEYEEEKLLLGFAYLESAGEAFASGDMAACLNYCAKISALDFKGGKFAAEQIKSRAGVYQKLCALENPENPDDSGDSGGDAYTFLREVLDGNSLCKYNILAANQSLAAGDAPKALGCLQEAERIIKDSGAHPYLSEIYKAFEACYVALEDYKNAHLYSSMLLKLYAEKAEK